MIPKPYSFSKTLSFVRSGGDENTGDLDDSKPTRGEWAFKILRLLPFARLLYV
jgi:hypothetical protein